ncbi:hypothetical protein [Embleya sp. NPDC020630]|uniref:hypothetical protein n=1 Tax=Embleya sp. NPDC020630 TaxID=3363979 RepID=UPI00378D9158
MHRIAAYLDGRPYRLITPRPSNTTRFAVNHFHDHGHVVSDRAGAVLFARLMWGLAHERYPNTLVVIDRRHLDPNPFDAEPSPPIVLFAGERTPFGGRAARDLRRLLPTLGRPDGTVHWRTHGLDAALTDRDAWMRRHPEPMWDWERERRHKRKPEDTMREGLFLLPADAEALRREAVCIAGMEVSATAPMAYEYLRRYRFQIFHDYRRRVSAARTARREIEALPVPPNRFDPWRYPDTDAPRLHIWDRGTEIRKDRMRGRRVHTRPDLYHTRSINDIQRSGETARERHYDAPSNT